MNKSFSVIIPTYNSDKYIEKCIDSLLKQNYDLNLIQILVIDDGSIDNIVSVMQKYKNNKSVEYYRKQNGQWGSVINYVKNNKLAKNEFISILDADDFLDQNAYKIINEKVKEADIFVGSFKKWDGNKERKKIHPYFFIFKRKLTNKRQMNTPFCLPLTFFVRKEVFYKINDLTEGMAYQDPDLISQFMLNAKSLRFTRKTIGYYYFNRVNNSISQVWSEKRFEAELNACLKCISNDAQEIVSYRLNLKNFYQLCKNNEIKFEIKRKMKFSFFPWYFRIFYFLIHRTKYRKLFRFN